MTASRAREAFVDRMAALIEAVDSADLVSKSLVSSERDPARLLRNGLAAVSYAAFEDFIVPRTFEVISHFDSSKIPFGRLPDKLREAATVAAVRAMSFRVSFEDPADRSSYMQRHSEYIASTSATNYRLSPLTFTSASTNITGDDIERTLKSVLVEGPWLQLANITSRVGYGLVGLRERITALLKLRNEAAHVAGADISVADLRQLPHDLLAVGLAFDALFSRAVRLIADRGASPAFNDANEKLGDVAKGISITFLDYDSKVVVERAETRTRAYQRHASMDDAVVRAVSRAATSRTLVVVRDRQRRPVDWRITDI